jgi:hypothetical protein
MLKDTRPAVMFVLDRDNPRDPQCSWTHAQQLCLCQIGTIRGIRNTHGHTPSSYVCARSGQSEGSAMLMDTPPKGRNLSLRAKICLKGPKSDPKG